MRYGPATGKLVSRADAIPLRDDGTLRLAVVADTHSLPHAATPQLLRTYAPDAILHAGDIGDLSVLDGLRAIAPLHAIRGNIDTRAPDLPDVLVIDVAQRLRILVVHIGVYGPKLRADVAQRARKENAQLVVCGHSHVPFLGADRGLTVFNPGSAGPRRFQLPIVFGTIELAAGPERVGVKFAHVDLETGRPWAPPA
ncbi:MAG: metallophosphoesterase family protein [Deltaproteobacteria bacterium]|nr:metallophosphoesterase family protein [Deltaproteobacteria bacterium]